MPGLGIGLTDLAKDVFGSDSVIRAKDDDRDGLASRIRACRPGLLAFNGKRAATSFLQTRVEYGEAAPYPDFPPIFVLPSTSGLASRFWEPAHWRALAARLALTLGSAPAFP